MKFVLFQVDILVNPQIDSVQCETTNLKNLHTYYIIHISHLKIYFLFFFGIRNSVELRIEEGDNILWEVLRKAYVQQWTDKDY